MTTSPFNATDEQKLAIETFDRPVLVISPPGTGKTAIGIEKYRKAHDTWGPGSVIIITFTRNASNMIKRRLKESGCDIDSKPGDSQLSRESPRSGTFHAIAIRVLTIAKRLGLYDGPTVMATEDEINRTLKEAVHGQSDLHVDKEWGKPTTASLRTYLGQVKNNGCIPVPGGYASIDEENMKIVETLPNPGNRIHQQMCDYQAGLARQDILDYDDVLIQATLMLEQDRHIILPLCKAVIVDEYQDVNPINERFITALAKGLSLTCLGDDDQSIYRWRNARVEYIQKFAERHPNTLTVILTKNYRSVAGITAIAQGVMKGVRNRIEKPELEQDVDLNDLPITIHAYQNAAGTYNPMSLGYLNELAIHTADICKRLIAGSTPEDDIIVLTRTNATAKQITSALETSGVSARLSNPNDLDSFELRSLVSWLRLLANPIAEGPLAQLARIDTQSRLMRDLSTEARLHGRTLIEHLSEKRRQKKLKHKELGEVVDQFEILSSHRETSSTKNLIDRACNLVATNPLTSENQNKIAHFWKAYTTMLTMLGDAGSIGDAVELLQASLSNDDITAEPGSVEVSTLHAAKGRQKPIVIISAVANGIMPGVMTYRAGNHSAEMDEERRLLYVAISRARTHVHVVTIDRDKSFLAELLPANATTIRNQQAKQPAYA